MINECITVMLVDDHPVTRAGYRRALENTANIQVIAEADNDEQCCALYQEFKPDVLIIDLNMQGIDGFETIRRIKKLNPTAHILVCSMHCNKTILRHALSAGATGYITKQANFEQMTNAIQQVNKGKTFIDPILTTYSGDVSCAKRAFDDPISLLTKRELQIFKLLAEGKSCVEIADLISISPKTVGVHYASILRKLNLQNIAQLVREAIRCEIID